MLPNRAPGLLLAYSHLPGKAFLEALINLPLAMPPTVVGFYLLIIMGPAGFLGRLWGRATGSPLLFTFAGIVVAPSSYSIPFALQPMPGGLRKDRIPGSSRAPGPRSLPSRHTSRVILPNSLNGIAAAAILVFLTPWGPSGLCSWSAAASLDRPGSLHRNLRAVETSSTAAPP
jgi:molybdate transport system permease protein